jgi:hypothetical protein
MTQINGLCSLTLADAGFEIGDYLEIIVLDNKIEK